MSKNPIDEDLDISFDQYLGDCKRYYNEDQVEWYGTYYEFATGMVTDYKNWVADKESWIEGRVYE